MTPTERANSARRNAALRKRLRRGTVGAGRFTAEERPETRLGLSPADASDVGQPDEVVEEHELSHLGIYTVTRADGSIVARNTAKPACACPRCHGESEKQSTCPECAGRGVIYDIPHCDRPWDQIYEHPSGGTLHLGGHVCQPAGGSCVVTDQFDTVVSLYSHDGFGPDPGIAHHTHTMIDGALDPADHDRVLELADEVVTAVSRGDAVMVRCMAGMNRSGLVAGLALVKIGWDADEAINHMREARSPYVLFNTDFTDFIRATAQKQNGDRRAAI